MFPADIGTGAQIIQILMQALLLLFGKQMLPDLVLNFLQPADAGGLHFQEGRDVKAEVGAEDVAHFVGFQVEGDFVEGGNHFAASGKPEIAAAAGAIRKFIGHFGERPPLDEFGLSLFDGCAGVGFGIALVDVSDDVGNADFLRLVEGIAVLNIKRDDFLVFRKRRRRGDTGDQPVNAKLRFSFGRTSGGSFQRFRILRSSLAEERGLDQILFRPLAGARAQRGGSFLRHALGHEFQHADGLALEIRFFDWFTVYEESGHEGDCIESHFVSKTAYNVRLRMIMQSYLCFRTTLAALAVGAALLGQSAPGPDVKAADPKSREMNGIPARTAPTEYQGQIKVGAVTLAADFTGHSVPTPESIFTTEDFVMCEVAFYGAPGTKLAMSLQDFSLRINGSKKLVPAIGDQFAFKSMKDPEWIPPTPPEKSKSGGISTGGGGQNDPPPVTPKMPIDVERKMEQKVLKAALPEGERALPAAGLIFFQYGGKVKGIRSLELVYTGAAGKAALPLQP